MEHAQMTKRRPQSILLLSCRSPFLDDSKIYCPMANLYLKSYLAQHRPGVTVVLGDDDYSVDDLSACEPFDAIGISIMTPQRQEAMALASAIKRRWPAKWVIGGGPHVRYYQTEIAAVPAFDYLVPLDGEIALAKILSGGAPRIVTNVLTREEVASQPRPDRTSVNASSTLQRYRYLLNGRPSTTMMAARGCPEQCTFCEDALTQVRWSSLDSIKAQLDDIVGLGYRGVYIFDDVFAMSAAKIRPICEELLRRDLIYRCNVQARYFTRTGTELAQLLADTGCYEIAFGAESGSQTILDNVRKRCTVEQNYATVACAKRFGLIVKAFILIGLPGETLETLRDTEAFIRDSGIDDFQCAVYMPFKGTGIRRAIDRGESIDLLIAPAGSDGEVTGAYGIKGGNTSYEVRTRALSADDLHAVRDHLVKTYRPESHKQKWADQDRFFEQAHVGT
jgi:radical SAM superfamily enzyme YgiQ (UPF0313 family)